MSVDKISSPVDIAVSGLRAESLRMKVIANNIANSQTTRTEQGQPYRRQEVVLSTSGSDLSGVRIEEVLSDPSDFKKVYRPGPDADADGYVRMPNVDLPNEIARMVMASRAYQANAAVLKRYQEAANQALELLK